MVQGWTVMVAVMLTVKVAVSAAIRPYQDKLIQCEIERAFTAGINYVDKKTCNVIYGVTCLPNNLQSMVQAEVLNLVRANIENSPEGKALLDNQLKLVKNLKTSIIEMSQREMQLFNAFKEASAKNPSLTYDEFIKTMK